MAFLIRFESATEFRCNLSTPTALGGTALLKKSYGCAIHRVHPAATKSIKPCGATTVGAKTFERNLRPEVAASSTLSTTSASHSRPAKSTLTRTPTRTSASKRAGTR